jgi:peroxiredoxin
LLPDGNGEFTAGMHMLVDKSNVGFGKRSWRYSMLVKDGVSEKLGQPALPCCVARPSASCSPIRRSASWGADSLA